MSRKRASNVRFAVRNSLRDHTGHYVSIHTIHREVNEVAQMEHSEPIALHQIRYALETLRKAGTVLFAWHERGWFKWYTYKLSQEGENELPF